MKKTTNMTNVTDSVLNRLRVVPPFWFLVTPTHMEHMDLVPAFSSAIQYDNNNNYNNLEIQRRCVSLALCLCHNTEYEVLM